MYWESFINIFLMNDYPVIQLQINIGFMPMCLKTYKRKLKQVSTKRIYTVGKNI